MPSNNSVENKGRRGKVGASKRKPAVTHHVVGSEEEDLEVEVKVAVSEDDDDDEKTSSKVDNEPEEPVQLPEGTVVVHPEPVEDEGKDFQGPEFKYNVRNKNNTSVLGDVLSERISCTACGDQVNPALPQRPRKHPILGVLVCNRCHKFYQSGEFTQDENGLDEYCRWCAEGGRLICCDYCPNAFCKSCIIRNLGRGELSSILDAAEDAKWHCYVCNPLPLTSLVESCDHVLKVFEKKEVKKDKRRSSPSRLTLSSSASLKNGEVDENDAAVKLAHYIHKILIGTDKIKGNIENLQLKLNKCVNNSHSLEGISKIKKISRKVHKTLQKYQVYVNQINDDLGSLEEEVGKQKRILKEKQKNVISKDEPNKKPPKKSGAESDDDGGVGEKENKRTVDENSENNSNRSCRKSKSETTQSSGNTKSKGSVTDSKDTSDDIHSNEDNVKETTPTILDICKTEPIESVDRNSSDKVMKRIKSTKGNCTKESRTLDQDTHVSSEEEGKDSDSSCKKENKMKSKIENQANEAAKKALLEEIKTDSSDDGGNKEADSAEEIKKLLKQITAIENPDVEDSEKESEGIKKGDQDIKDNSGNIVRKNKKLTIKNEKCDNDLPCISKDIVNAETALIESSDSDKKEDDDAKSSVSLTGSPRGPRQKTTLRKHMRVSPPISDEEVHKKRTKKKNNNLKTIDSSDSNCGTSSDSDSSLDLSVETIVEKPKPKEKSVAVKPMVSDESKVTKKRKNSNESDIDKEIERLSKLPVLKKVKVQQSGDEDGEDTAAPSTSLNLGSKSRDKSKKAKTSAADDISLSTSSDEESSEDEKIEQASDNKKVSDIKPLKDTNINDLSKTMLKNEIKSSESSSSSDSSDDSLESYNSKPSKASHKKIKIKKKEISDNEILLSSSSEKDYSSDDDFVKNKKKGKYDSLLNTKLNETDTEEELEKGRKTKGSLACKFDKSGESKDDKKKKRRVINSDFSASSSDSSDSDASDTDEKFKRKTRSKKTDSDNDKKKSKKRKRIKVIDSSESDSDSTLKKKAEEENAQKSLRRKKIRKLIGDEKLQEETKAAAKAEEERRKRVAERQKLYNQMITVDKETPEGPIHTKLVLEADPKTKDVIIEIHPSLVRKLKPHQVEGVMFMWECCIETIETAKKEVGSGCILAHCMGLGKTLQIVSFIHSVLTSKKLNIRTCLVVCPLNTVLNWVTEFNKWLTDDIQQLNIYELTSVKNNIKRSIHLEDWHDQGGVMIMGYDMYRNLSQPKGKVSKKLITIFQKTLVDPGPNIVICDEGHILKNDATALSKAMNNIKTQRRIVLTGTPLQNNLPEYHCMVSFVKPNLLGTRKEFINRFVNPIINGQCADSTPRDVKLMKKRAHILHNLLAGCVQRRDYSALTKFLPPKHEYVISVRLSDRQINLYRHYLSSVVQNRVNSTLRNSLFLDYQNLMMIWTHPQVLKLGDIRRQNRAKYDETDEDSMDSFIDDNSLQGSDSEKSIVPLESDSDGAKSKKKKKGSNSTEGSESEPEIVNTWTSRTRGRSKEIGESSKSNTEVVCLEEKEEEQSWWSEFLSEEDKSDLLLSGKLVLLFEVLKQCEAIGDKTLLFSQSLLSLDLIESMLANVNHFMCEESLKDENKEEDDTPSEKLHPSLTDYLTSWIQGIDYFRMDGSTSPLQRKKWANEFNDFENHRARLFLISTRAGSLGINLVAANRVIIFDASWNPTHDVQSIFRVYRFGQTKPVYVYRFLAQGTMEEKIYERQITKLSLSGRVVDEHQIERHFTAADLAELYTFSPDLPDAPAAKRPTPLVPKDRLLAEMLISKQQWIVQYHEHDSLLEHTMEEELTEEERKAAWAEFELEKKGLVLDANIHVPLDGIFPELKNMVHSDPYSRNSVTTIIQLVQQKFPDLSQDELNNKVQTIIQTIQTLQNKILVEQQQRLKQQQMQQQEEMRRRIEYQNQMRQQQQVYAAHRPYLQAQLRQMMNMGNIPMSTFPLYPGQPFRPTGPINTIPPQVSKPKKSSVVITELE